MSASDIETAERLGRRRARMAPVLALFFLIQQSAYFANGWEGDRTVDHVRLSAWLAMSIVLLLGLTTGGFWFRSKAVRTLMNDEVTRANQADALKLGFIATMLAGIVLYFITLFEPVGGREAVHLLMTAGIAVALLRFGMLERRALRGG